MARLSSEELLRYSLAVDALRDVDFLQERMVKISSRYTYFTVNTDLIGVYWLSNEIVIAVNGSNTLWEWVDNFKIRKTKQGFHRGFYATAFLAFEEIMNMREIQNNCLPITIAGHSRGGFGLIINALIKSLEEHKRDIKTVTFGSPRMGNKKACRFMEQLEVEHHRVHADRDFVDNLAPRIFGYKHYQTEEYALGTAKGKLDHKAYTELLREETTWMNK